VLFAAIAAVAASVAAADAFLGLAVVLAIDVGSRWANERSALAIALVLGVLLALIFNQVAAALLSAASGFTLAAAGILLLRLLQRTQSELAQRDEDVATLAARLENQRIAISAIEQQGRAAERNRLAARIHDKVGHGMTGSILMLEAAQLQLDQDPAAARASVELACENLRKSVEEIRRELRAERAAGEPADLGRIVAELKDFAARYPAISTELKTLGALDRVPSAIWLCEFESLRETLTNLLKHSNADCLRVIVRQKDRLLSVEFSDNGQGTAVGVGTVASAVVGSSAGKSAVIGVDAKNPGIGLAAIEERTLLSGGRAFFELTPRGFSTRLLFTLRG
jgi:signal transduction histidine kinase